MDFAACNAYDCCLRVRPVAKKSRLQGEESGNITRRNVLSEDLGKLQVTRWQGEAECSFQTDGPLVERRTQKETISGGELDQAEGPQTVEERRTGKAELLEEEDVKGTEEQSCPGKTLDQVVIQGEGGGGGRVAGRSEQNVEVKRDQESDQEEELEKEGAAEEMPHLGYKGEEEEMPGVEPEPFVMKEDSQEPNPAKRKPKTSEALEDGAERKAKRSRSKSTTSKVEAPRNSRKRKSEEKDKCLRGKKRKKDEGPRGKRSKAEEEKWKWWEEERREDGVKWYQLKHKGPYFAPPYERLPGGVRFYYDGKPMKLSRAAEEVATFFAKMLDQDYTRKRVFRNNFFCDWIQEMTPEERRKIRDLSKCDFSEIHKYFLDKREAQKALSNEKKQKLKKEAERIQEEYGYCIIDGHREKIGNFRIEPPGLFRGRGDHPKMGMLKKRIMPEDVTINCSKGSKTPQPPRGHKWKEVRCDNTVTWLAAWTENIQGSIKYIMLNPSSKLKGQKDWQKYEVARRLKAVVRKIRCQYRADWKSKEMKKRQISVALYFIDRLALRAGNEKEEGETADTVGCCSLRVEHLTLHPWRDGQENVVEFDFLGKDCVRYYNKMPVEKQVFKNLKLFMEDKELGDNLFDRLSTATLNKHLQDLMDGLTAKVFRTYNASITLQEQLEALTNEDDPLAAKLLSYNRANRAVAVLCNHQRAVPKTHEKSMQNLQDKMDAKKNRLAGAKAELRKAKAKHKTRKDATSKGVVERKTKLVRKIEDQLCALKLRATDKEENKQIALGTSKLNYLDPRITVAWCKRFDVPVEKVFSKAQREKFAWAIDMADEDFEF